MLMKFGARRWIARIMFTWGLLAVGMMFIKTPMQFYVMRFLLGAAEAGFFPGVVFYLMHWFPAHERGRAISRFYVALPLSSVVMGSLAGALLNLDGQFGLAGWQWLFLVEGLPAIALSIVILIALPDSPAQARWLTGDERAWIKTQLAADDARPGVAADAGVLRALVEPRVWLLGLSSMCILGAAYAFNLSAPALLQGVTQARCNPRRLPDRRRRRARRRQHDHRRLALGSAPRATPAPHDSICSSWRAHSQRWDCRSRRGSSCSRTRRRSSSATRSRRCFI